MFRVDLLTSNEVPPVPGLVASGAGSVEVIYTNNGSGGASDATVRYDINYDFPADVTITGLQIHPGAAGETGPPSLSAPLSTMNTVVDEDGNGMLSYTIQVISEDDLGVLSDLLADPTGAYVNLYTTANPNGGDSRAASRDRRNLL